MGNDRGNDSFCMVFSNQCSQGEGYSPFSSSSKIAPGQGRVTVSPEQADVLQQFKTLLASGDWVSLILSLQ